MGESSKIPYAIRLTLSLAILIMIPAGMLFLHIKEKSRAERISQIDRELEEALSTAFASAHSVVEENGGMVWSSGSGSSFAAGEGQAQRDFHIHYSTDNSPKEMYGFTVAVEIDDLRTCSYAIDRTGPLADELGTTLESSLAQLCARHRIEIIQP